MTSHPRYAIYYAPLPDSALAHFGSSVLGYDAASGCDVPFDPVILSAAPDWRELTESPRRYGFHATLKAPFTLAPGRAESALIDACVAFAQTPRVIPVITPEVASIGRFVALVPASPPESLMSLAADCVTTFDDFRAPLTATDRARRHPDRLTPSQRAHLDRWGYPHVMDDFRFHMTLSGSLDENRRAMVRLMLVERYAALGLTTLAIDHIALFRQDAPTTRFRVVGNWPLQPL
jgi:putative phosphonate metabolism protein